MDIPIVPLENESFSFVLGSSSKWRRHLLENALVEYVKLRNPACDEEKARANIRIQQWSPDIDEKAIRDACPERLVTKVATAKVEAALKHFHCCGANRDADAGDKHEITNIRGREKINTSYPSEWVLACDQIALYYCKDASDPMIENALKNGRCVGHLSSSTDGSAEETRNSGGNGVVDGNTLVDKKKQPFIILEKPESADENRLFLRSYRNYAVSTVAAQVLYHVPTGKWVSGIEENVVYFGAISDAVIENLIGRGDSMHCCGGFVVEDEELSRCVERIEGSLEGIQGLGPALLMRLLDKSVGNALN